MQKTSSVKARAKSTFVAKTTKVKYLEMTTTDLNVVQKRVSTGIGLPFVGRCC
jgi:hypothetical protein